MTQIYILQHHIDYGGASFEGAYTTLERAKKQAEKLTNKDPDWTCVDNIWEISSDIGYYSITLVNVED